MTDPGTEQSFRDMLNTICLTKEPRLPEPYYSEAGITLYNADCQGILPLLGPVDVCVTDPPYGETALEWDVRADCWLPLLKTQQLWCCGSFRFFLESPFTGWRHVQEIVWEKHNGSSFQADRFRRVHEYVAHFVKEDVAWGDCYHVPIYTFNGIDKNSTNRKGQTPHLGYNPPVAGNRDDRRLMRSVFALPSMQGKAVHPTQKPVALFTPLLEFSCPPGGTVLDPFCGSGSVLLAAKQLGRRAIGVEIREAYCQITVDRLRQSVLPFPPKPPMPAAVQTALFRDIRSPK